MRGNGQKQSAMLSYGTLAQRTLIQAWAAAHSFKEKLDPPAAGWS